jgi:hypothetical protein
MLAGSQKLKFQHFLADSMKRMCDLELQLVQLQQQLNEQQTIVAPQITEPSVTQRKPNKTGKRNAGQMNTNQENSAQFTPICNNAETQLVAPPVSEYELIGDGDTHRPIGTAMRLSKVDVPVKRRSNGWFAKRKRNKNFQCQVIDDGVSSHGLNETKPRDPVPVICNINTGDVGKNRSGSESNAQLLESAVKVCDIVELQQSRAAAPSDTGCNDKVIGGDRPRNTNYSVGRGSLVNQRIAGAKRRSTQKIVLPLVFTNSRFVSASCLDECKVDLSDVGCLKPVDNSAVNYIDNSRSPVTQQPYVSTENRPMSLTGAAGLSDRRPLESDNVGQSCVGVAQSVRDDPSPHNTADDPVGLSSSAIRAIRDDSPMEKSASQLQHAIQNRCRAAAVNTTSDCTDCSDELVPDPETVAADRSRTAVEKGRVVAASAVTSSSQPEVGLIGRGDALCAYSDGKHGQQLNATSELSIAGHESADKTDCAVKSIMAELLSRVGVPPRGLYWC